MSAIVPDKIKIYHIVHISKLPAILAEECLLSDAEMRNRPTVGAEIGMREIKRRRLEELELASHPGLHVGECVPFYFCPRSIMLYMFHMRNHPDIDYRGGQEPILHLVADFYQVVDWADNNSLRWAFSRSNAGSYYFEDYSSISDLDKVNWNAVTATNWSSCKDEKQAEFLIERRFSMELIEDIGVHSFELVDMVNEILVNAEHKPRVRIAPEWYY